MDDLDPRQQRAAARLVADRDAFAPPPGLADRTLARVAAARRPVWADRDPIFAGWGWLRADVLVAAGLGFVAVLVGASAVAKVRADSRTVACQERLRELHTALSGYGETHAGRLPRPGSGWFADELTRAGQLPAGLTADCPAGEPVSYHYTLGHVTAGTVVGPRTGDPDGAPLTADPPAGASPHRGGQNVLYAGGRVRFATAPTAGLFGDHIYRNDAGKVRAGLHPADAVLGGPADCP